jgi:hypothetical protein
MLKKYKPSKYNIEIDSGDGNKLIYNTLSQVFSILEKDDICLYEKVVSKVQEDLVPEEETLLDHFLVNNFLVPNDIDETVIFENKYKMSRITKENMILTILPTLIAISDVITVFREETSQKK